MGVTAQDHINAGNLLRHLAVHVKAVVAEQDNNISAFLLHFLNHLLNPRLANTKGKVREHPARIGNRHVREGLTDHGNLGPATLKNLVGFKRRFVPLIVKDVGSQEREGQLFDDLVHPINAVGELPVRGHRIRVQRVHQVHHVLTIGLQRRHGTVPGIPAIQEQRIRTLRTDRLHDGGHPVQPAHFAVAAGQ